MFTKLTVTLALVLVTTCGALAATKKHISSASRAYAAPSTQSARPAFSPYSSYGISTGPARGDAWDRLRERNRSID